MSIGYAVLRLSSCMLDKKPAPKRLPCLQRWYDNWRRAVIVAIFIVLTLACSKFDWWCHQVADWQFKTYSMVIMNMNQPQLQLIRLHKRWSDREGRPDNVTKHSNPPSPTTTFPKQTFKIQHSITDVSYELSLLELFNHWFCIALHCIGKDYCIFVFNESWDSFTIVAKKTYIFTAIFSCTFSLLEITAFCSQRNNASRFKKISVFCRSCIFCTFSLCGAFSSMLQGLCSSFLCKCICSENICIVGQYALIWSRR